MDVWFAVRTDGALGSGTESDPYFRSSAPDLDTLLASILANTTIHLGPGVFETRGCANDIPGGWEAKSGQRIVGSGIGITVLKLVEAVSTAKKTYAIGMHDNGTAFLDGFEVSDLTIDCNLAGQPIPQGQTFANFCCCAIYAPGRHIRIRRVRVIRFGTQNAVLECFPIFVGYSLPDRPMEVCDCVVEDCVVEEPSFNNVRETTCISIGYGENETTGVMAYHRGCVIRRCHVDGEYKDRPVPIATLTINTQTGIATATTRSPHGRSDGDWVVITGALENGSPNTTYNGSHEISVDPNYPSRFTYTPGAGGGHPAPTVDATGDMWVGRYSSHFVEISTAEWANGVVTVTTTTPHFRRPGDNVCVLNVRVWDPSIQNWTTTNAYNGVFELTETGTPYEFKYSLGSDPGTTNCEWASIGVYFQGITADGGSAAVIEDNFVRQVARAVYHDTYNSKDLTVRNNVFTEVRNGVRMAMGGRNVAKPGAALTHVGKIATFTTVLDHGLAPGDAVIVENTTYPEYNNLTTPPPPRPPAWELKSVLDSRRFTYEMLGTPAGNEPSPPTFTFRTLWREKRLLIENNVIEVVGAIRWWGQAIGVFLTGGPEGAPYVYREVVVRGNIIRHPVGVADAPGTPATQGIVLRSADKAIIENNVIDVESAYPITWGGTGAMRLFHNQASNGRLLDGYSEATTKWWRDAAKDVEDAFILALI